MGVVYHHASANVRFEVFDDADPHSKFLYDDTMTWEDMTMTMLSGTDPTSIIF
jgi:hypothetical protein